MSISNRSRSLCSLGHCPKLKGKLHPRAGAYSDIGTRESNDDRVFAGDRCRLYLALDGIGGHAGGGEASRIVLDRLRSTIESMCANNSLRPDEDLRKAVTEALSAATKEMINLASKRPVYEKMGTVFALAYIIDDTLLYSRVGDARVYLVRHGRARQLTSDETYVQLMVDAGVIKPDDVREHPMRNVVLNAVGTHPNEGSVVVHSEPLMPGDIVVLTTDGVSDKVPDGVLASLVAADEAPDALAQSIVDAALHAGTSDNASCVVVSVRGSEEPPATRHGELHKELARVHQMLAELDSVDDELQSELQQIAEDIRRALHQGEQTEVPEFARELRDRVLDLEVSHPRLTNVVASITNLLASMGI